MTQNLYPNLLKLEDQDISFVSKSDQHQIEGNFIPKNFCKIAFFSKTTLDISFGLIFEPSQKCYFRPNVHWFGAHWLYRRCLGLTSEHGNRRSFQGL